MRFGLLGPLTADGAGGPVSLGGPRHRAIVARLLLARGRVVPVTRLIDDLWDDPPAGALGAVQTFVGELRKVLEPGRAPRTPARLLVTAPPGYALRVGPDDVDALRFETALATSADLLARDPAAARDLLDAALALWRGPALAEFAEQDWARAEAARLEELRLLATARRTEAALAAGGGEELVPDLAAAVAEHPLREEGWRLLALALYRAGRQGEALGTLRRARAVLRDELGVDPGPALRQLEADVLAQAPRLEPPPAPRAPLFVGRDAELAALDRAARTVAATRRPHLVLVSGPAGGGKSALVRAAAARLAAAGWRTAVSASLEDPSGLPAAQQLGLPSASGPDRHRAAAAHLAGRTADGPVLLGFDDLHWADEETLALLTALATADAGAVLLVGALRGTDDSPALTAALGRLARTEPTRLPLGGLDAPEVGALVAALTDGGAAEDDTRTIAERSGGNPFFVRELTRLWSSAGPAGLRSVPAGVRDVVRHRLTQLPATARTHLRQAAVLGDPVDLDVLVPLGGDEEQVLASVEAALLAGFLTESDADRVHFDHALVRETVYADVPAARRARWHAAAADLLEQQRPDDVEAIAGHLLRAGRRVPAARTARWARAAAERAEQRQAVHEAARLWRAVLAALDRSGAAPVRERLDAVMGLGRALAVTGDLARARALRAAAVDDAEAAGDPLLTARVLGGFDVPAVWTASDDEVLSARLAAAAERTLAVLPAGADADRARLLTTIATERRADPTLRGRVAAEEAVALARASGDPALLAPALNGLFLQSFGRAGLAPERGRIGAELVAVAGRGGLATHEVLGHLVQLQSCAALADLAGADAHAAAADALARRHDLPVVGVFTRWYGALRLAVRGEVEQAATAYREAAAGLTGTGMPGVEDGLLGLALRCLGAMPSGPDLGPYAPWTGSDAPDSPRDLLFEARSCLAAPAVIAAGDRVRTARLYEQLLPAAGELAGAGSGLVTLGPVAQTLGELAAALGGDGRGHFTRALAVAERAGAPHWAAAARRALSVQVPGSRR